MYFVVFSRNSSFLYHLTMLPWYRKNNLQHKHSNSQSNLVAWHWFLLNILHQVCHAYSGHWQVYLKKLNRNEGGTRQQGAASFSATGRVWTLEKNKLVFCSSYNVLSRAVFQNLLEVWVSPNTLLTIRFTVRLLYLYYNLTTLPRDVLGCSILFGVVLYIEMNKIDIHVVLLVTWCQFFFSNTCT